MDGVFIMENPKKSMDDVGVYTPHFRGNTDVYVPLPFTDVLPSLAKLQDMSTARNYLKAQKRRQAKLGALKKKPTEMAGFGERVFCG